MGGSGGSSHNGDQGLSQVKSAFNCQASALGHILTFMMRSGLIVPSPLIPMPAFEVPNAAPMAGRLHRRLSLE